ncbi:MAG: hemolysin III family protein, partial [Clostridia bacterium]
FRRYHEKRMEVGFHLSKSQETNQKPVPRISIPKYTLCEELINAISHGVGALFGVAALVLCLVRAISGGRGAASIAGACVFGSTLILLYTVSTLYHALKINKAKRVFRVLDHCTIFLLIAGTYTPYTLVTLQGSVGWLLFTVIWAAAALGVTLNAVNLRKYAVVSVFCYLAMGWAIVFAIRPLSAAMAPAGVTLLIWGGIAYTVGAILYAIGSKRKYFHSIFHFFCLIGSMLHFLSIYQYVL